MQKDTKAMLRKNEDVKKEEEEEGNGLVSHTSLPYPFPLLPPLPKPQ